MRLKKITALFLTGALILSMAGCAGNGSKDKKEGSAGNEAQEPKLKNRLRSPQSR